MTTTGVESIVVLAFTLAVIAAKTGENWRGWMGIDRPGRLTAPQTVLKTAFLESIDVRGRPIPIEADESNSAEVRSRAPSCAKLAVILAVRWRSRRGRSLAFGRMCRSAITRCRQVVAVSRAATISRARRAGVRISSPRHEVTAPSFSPMLQTPM